MVESRQRKRGRAGLFIHRRERTDDRRMEMERNDDGEGHSVGMEGKLGEDKMETERN